ncbi:unnamed protein product [Blepharisma stoltei]|uniref:Uncharacterized protein n=1 Tax=Blepharisma stoltei TaxID=1481888 RepID=A0AAU9KPD1_9CILI|nr:unnamed protein product [Blepharisma stoltei]
MGCGASKDKDPKIVSGIIKVKQVEDEEIDQIVELPLRAREEDIDLFSIVELSISCSNLHHYEHFRVPDPMVIFYVEDESGACTEKSRTEIQNCSQNPSFITSFKVSYCFEKQLKFKFDVFDMKDPNNPNLDKQGYIGTVRCNIHEIVCSPTRSIARQLENTQNKRKIGLFTVSSEEMSDLNHHVKMQWEIDSRNLRGPLFIKLYRISHDNEVPIYQSETSDSHPFRWDIIDLSVNNLCRGDDRRKIKLEVYKSDRKKNELIGACQFCLADLRQNNNFQDFISFGEKTIATLNLIGFQYEEKVTFLDYIFGGCEISLIVGIDFTKSNGLPSANNSLHYLDIDHPNEYIQALSAVGEILQYYDSDKKIPVYGFGAKLPPLFDIISHCFALNGNIFDPEVKGISEVLEAYKSALSTVRLHGPTIFNELIQTAITYASTIQVSQKHQQYFILLVLTDGMINDIDYTIDEIVRAGEFPLSIIIVGVGNEDFSMMEQLDADIHPLYSKRLKKNMKRDIVQFVPFSKFKSNPSDLAKEVLYEVPKQLIAYMKGNGILPNEEEDDKNLYRTNTAGQKMIPSPQKMHDSAMLLSSMKEQFIGKVEELGFEREKIAEVVEEGVCCMDVNIVVEILEQRSSMTVRKSVLRKSNSKTLSVPPSKVRFENDNKYYIIDKDVN